jgi:hypothetical protein
LTTAYSASRFSATIQQNFTIELAGTVFNLVMSTCQAPHRLPVGYYERLETMTPEEAALTFISEVLADDYACGDHPAVGTIEYGGRTLPVCQYHNDFFQNYIAPLEIQN